MNTDFYYWDLKCRGLSFSRNVGLVNTKQQIFIWEQLFLEGIMNIDISSEKISLILSFIQTIAIIPVFVYLLIKLLLMLRWINPIRIEIEDHHGTEGVLINLGKTRKIKELRKRKDLIPSMPHFIINISSILTDKSIRVFPRVYIKVIDVKKIPNDFNQIRFRPGKAGGGGGGFNRHFVITIPPTKNETVEASFIPGEENEGIVDFFIIGPNDIEAFMLMVDFEAEFIYTLKIGVEYYYRGKRQFIWRGDYRVGKSISNAKQWGFYTFDDNAEISAYIPIEPDYESRLGK